MNDEPKRVEPTELDEALKAARADRACTNLFYDTFLNTEIFIPALRADKRPGEWEKLSSADRFFPLYLKQEEERYVPVFDRLEKMKVWSGNKAFDYITLPAHLFLQVIAPEIGLVLNEGTEYRYLFPPEILQSLRTAVKPVMLN